MKSFISYSLLRSLAWAHSNGSIVWCVLPLLGSSRDEVGCPSSCSKVVAPSPRARASYRLWLLTVWWPSWLLCCWSPPVEEGLGSFAVSPRGCIDTPESVFFLGPPAAGGEGSTTGGFKSSTAFWSRSNWPSGSILAKCFWMSDEFRSYIDVTEQKPFYTSSFMVSSDSLRSLHHSVKSMMITERATLWQQAGCGAQASQQGNETKMNSWPQLGQDQRYWTPYWTPYIAAC